MKECSIINCNSTSLVYSGTDALCLGGIPTEKYCYSCAGAYMVIKAEMEALLTSS